MPAMRLPWLFVTAVLSSILAVLAELALENYLYWRFEWFDLPMHFLGGAMTASLLVALLMHFRPRLFILGAVVVFIGWEIFEYALGFPKESNYVFDTSLDILMDTLGAVVIYTIARFTTWRSR